MNKRKRKHVGQWMDVDGEPVHVLADPNMSDATRDALAELVRHTRKMLDDGWTPDDDSDESKLERFRREMKDESDRS